MKACSRQPDLVAALVSPAPHPCLMHAETHPGLSVLDVSDLGLQPKHGSADSSGRQCCLSHNGVNQTLADCMCLAVQLMEKCHLLQCANNLKTQWADPDLLRLWHDQTARSVLVLQLAVPASSAMAVMSGDSWSPAETAARMRVSSVEHARNTFCEPFELA